ncbi:MAG TPA: NAD(P)-dependent oxidoreductase, partial [Stenomitos sp.]
MNVNTKVGLIGTGLMGLPMAQRLAELNVPTMAFNRTSAKLEPLRNTTVELAASVDEVLAQCQVVIVMLTNADAVRSLLLQPNQLPLWRERTLIQMGTIAPSDSRDLCAQITSAGGEYLEAPVLGSIPEVKAGTLLVMVGATEGQFQQWKPLLQSFGTEPRHIGEVGSAAALKLALNQMIAALTTGFALSLEFVKQQGVPVETFMDILRQSALYAPTFDKKLQRMLEGNYANPNFPTQHLLKDVRLFLAEATMANLQLDSLEGIRHILDTACDRGMAEA